MTEADDGAAGARRGPPRPNMPDMALDYSDQLAGLKAQMAGPTVAMEELLNSVERLASDDDEARARITWRDGPCRKRAPRSAGSTRSPGPGPQDDVAANCSSIDPRPCQLLPDPSRMTRSQDAAPVPTSWGALNDLCGRTSLPCGTSAIGSRVISTLSGGSAA